MLKCESYLIDSRTLAVKPIFVGKYQSKIITTHGIYFSELTPQNLLNEACLRYFTTKKGRMEAATLLLNYDKKPPFLIAPNEIGVFPTASSKNPNCVWIFNHRFTVKEIGKKQSIVTFMDGTTIQVKTSKHTIMKQNQRMHTLLSTSRLMEREKQLYQKDQLV